MEEQNEDVAHAAWYQTALTSGISAGLVIRHAQPTLFEIPIL